jgi:hypothetical protein
MAAEGVEGMAAEGAEGMAGAEGTAAEGAEVMAAEGAARRRSHVAVVTASQSRLASEARRIAMAPEEGAEGFGICRRGLGMVGGRLR